MCVLVISNQLYYVNIDMILKKHSSYLILNPQVKCHTSGSIGSLKEVHSQNKCKKHTSVLWYLLKLRKKID